jgi:uncharacterized protein YhfF
MTSSSVISDFWQEYRATLPADGPSEPFPLVDAFVDQAALADELGRLVLAGIKTATCSALWEWEAEGSELPQVGTRTISHHG